MTQPSDSPPQVVLFVRQGCHLCEQFRVELEIEFGPDTVPLRVVDVDTDADLATAFGLRVPVLQVGETVICEGVCDAARVRAALRL